MALRFSANHGLARQMPRVPRWTKLLVFGALPLLAASCGGQPGGPASVFGRLEGAGEIFFAHESTPSCALEASLGDKAPTAEAQWVKVPPNALTNRQFAVVQKVGGGDKGGKWTRALALRDADGTAMWVRNVPAATPQEIDERWSCAVPGKDVQALSFDLHATAVQLLPYGPHCHGMTPILGSADDVRFAPYALVARRLFIGSDKNPVLGITLAAPGNERLLTVTASDLQSCFGAVAPSVLSPEETAAFLSWVTLPSPDAKPAPPVSFGVVLASTGLDPTACIRDGSAGNVECRQPLFGVLPAEVGPYGVPALLLTAQRVVGALHGAGDKLVSGAELPGETILVRAPKVKNTGLTFTRAFNAALAESVQSSEKQLARGAHGVRIVRAQDANAAAAQPSQVLEADVTYTVTDAPPAPEKRAIKTLTNAKQAQNPELARARASAARAAQQSALAVSEGVSLRLLAAVNAPACSGVAPVCNFVTTSLADFAASREKAAALRAKQAEDVTRTLPENVAADDVIEATVKVIHRHGEANVDVRISPVDPKSTATAATFTLRVPFETEGVEVPNDPAHKLTARPPRMPTQDDVEKALAEALVPRLDLAIGDFAERRMIRTELATLQPGTRAWMAGAARHAAGDRPVKLFGDVIESRPDALRTGSLVYPVKIPGDGEQRCFTFVAAPSEGFGDVNLSFGVDGGPGRFVTLASDARRAPVASFELCHTRPGNYALAIAWPADGSVRGIIASMFDSTPGAVSDADASAAREGKPTPLQ